MLKEILTLVVCISHVTGDVSHLLTPPAPPPSPAEPFVFGYAAGRYPGHIDRTHFETSDASGTVRGTYSYIDPLQRVRTVDYVADKDGFHPQFNDNPTAAAALPQDTAIVAQAKQKHLEQFNEIAQMHRLEPLQIFVVPQNVGENGQLYGAVQKIVEQQARFAKAGKVGSLGNDGGTRVYGEIE